MSWGSKPASHVAGAVHNARLFSSAARPPLFTQLLPEYLDDDGYREIQLHLVGDPEAGDLIPGTGGFRKLRWRDRRRGKGKRGGLRIVYYYFIADSHIWFMTLYDKDEVEDLSPDEKRLLKAAIEQESRQRARRRGTRRE